MTIGTTSSEPDWAHCGRGTNPVADPVGCRGSRVPSRTACLVHLDESHRAAYFSGLAPGADVDHRDTSFTKRLLEDLLHALRDPGTGHPRFGHAQFDYAEFRDGADFEGAEFRAAGSSRRRSTAHPT